MIDATVKQGALRLMTSFDLERVLSLRNHADVRCYMLTQHEISIEEHMLWFESASKKPGLELLVFEQEQVCCGFVQFKDTQFLGVVEWGFYTAPDAPKGTGKALGLAAINHAFRKDNLHKICGQALLFNQPSIDFHKSLGFVQEGILRDHHFDGVAHHDLICFGLLRREWAAKESLAGKGI